MSYLKQREQFKEADKHLKNVIIIFIVATIIVSIAVSYIF